MSNPFSMDALPTVVVVALLVLVSTILVCNQAYKDALDLQEQALTKECEDYVEALEQRAINAECAVANPAGSGIYFHNELPALCQ